MGRTGADTLTALLHKTGLECVVDNKNEFGGGRAHLLVRLEPHRGRVGAAAPAEADQSSARLLQGLRRRRSPCRSRAELWSARRRRRTRVSAAGPAAPPTALLASAPARPRPRRCGAACRRCARRPWLSRCAARKSMRSARSCASADVTSAGGSSSVPTSSRKGAAAGGGSGTGAAGGSCSKQLLPFAHVTHCPQGPLVASTRVRARRA